MALTIEQKPLYKTIPANAPIIYTVSDSTAIGSKFKVKYVADVYVNLNRTLGVDLNTISSSLVNTVKVSPNAVGVGIMDLRNVISNSLTSQKLGSTSGNGSTSKGSSLEHSIHLIDKYARDEEGLRWFTVHFKVEYSDTASGVVSDSGQNVYDAPRLAYNGYLTYSDYITRTGKHYGYNLEANNYIMNSADDKFLSDMPTELYARIEDFGTVSYGVFYENATEGFDTGYKYPRFKLHLKSGSVVTVDESLSYTAGFSTSYGSPANVKNTYMAFYPANLIGFLGTDWTDNVDDIEKYTVQIMSSSNEAVSKLYTVNIIKDDCKGYEGFRLAWLNKFGVWDYYTFNKKSVRTINSKRQNYNQNIGSWDGDSYVMNGSLGGKRSFNVSSKESITINTDYISEEEGIWLESLSMSSEVYLINKNESDDSTGLINKYVEPVIVTNSSITRKTQANDKLVNHTFTIEKSRSENTQRI